MDDCSKCKEREKDEARFSDHHCHSGRRTSHSGKRVRAGTDASTHGGSANISAGRDYGASRRADDGTHERADVRAHHCGHIGTHNSVDNCADNCRYRSGDDGANRCRH